MRMLLGIPGVALGLVMQVARAFADKPVRIGISSQYCLGALGVPFTVLGLAVMGHPIYKWATN